MATENCHMVFITFPPIFVWFYMMCIYFTFIFILFALYFFLCLLSLNRTFLPIIYGWSQWESVYFPNLYGKFLSTFA